LAVKAKGGVVAAKGFRAAGVRCGIKDAEEALDLALIVSDVPASAAGLFTKNRVCAAPVKVSRQRVRRGSVRAIVANSGNANACTGARGMRDAREMAALAARSLGVRPADVLVASTGRIGRFLPMAKVRKGIADAAAALARGPQAAGHVVRAIMTTDTVPKSFALRTTIAGTTIHVGGIAKGAGMIAPHMATMHCFVTTDAAVCAPLLRRALRHAVDASFNCIRIDGDMSTNDTIAVLANGAAGGAEIKEEGKAYQALEAALTETTRELAMMLVRDGEGATRLVEIAVTRARSERDARTIARSIADSLLVKTALYSGDPNWGRIMCAAGYAGASIREDRLRLRLQGTTVFDRGEPVRFAAAGLAKRMKRRGVRIELDLGLADAAATVWTCDLSNEYVSINADYHT